MGGSVGLSGDESKSNNQSEFGQDIWGPQGDALKRMYGQAGDIFGAGNSGKGNAEIGQGIQDQMGGGAYKDMGLQDSLMGSLQQSMNSPSASQEINNMIMGGSGNNYADAMKGQYMDDANKAQEMMLANTDARANASGMSGSSMHGRSMTQGFDNINKNLQSNLARTGYESFDKDLDRKLQIAGKADQGTLQRQQMMQQMLGGQQGAMQGGVNAGMGYQNQQNMLPWQQGTAYSNMIGAPTTLSSGRSNSSSSSKGNEMQAGGGKKGG